MLPHPHRIQFAVRATLFLVTGMLIAFTANLHDTLFSSVVFALSVLALVLAELIVGVLASRERKIALSTLLHTIIAVAAAVVIFVVPENLDVFALTVTIWAALTAVLEVWVGWLAKDSRHGRELRVTGIMAGLLALLTVLVPANPVSVLGLYGGYCFVVGVYLAIAAYDRGSVREQESRA